MDSTERKRSDLPDQGAPSHVVGIGASAGGLEALERLFKSLPSDTGMAFVIVQHLSPDFNSVMDELLVRQTDMPVQTVEDGVVVRPNAVYLIPPRKEMIISGGKLLLTDKELNQGLSLPIDTFFRSLAQECGDRGVGVVLSGTGSDGSRGIREIHNAGGLVLAQSEDTAKFDGMPRSAQETGVVDLVLSPERLAETLVKYADNPSVSDLLDGQQSLPINEDSMNRLMRVVRDVDGVDFSLYKPTTVKRRIERRLQAKQLTDFDDYVAQAASDPEELNSLYRDLLIGVTHFFRDGEAFGEIEKNVLPELVRKLPTGEELRIWVAGCATGEEAYSLAILVSERFEALGRPVNAKIFATDVHRASLEIAGAGVYPESSLADVSHVRREKFFVRRGDKFQIAQDLRQMVVFAHHNIIKDAPFTRMDLVSCRNLLIYLQPAVQKKVISLFHFGLKTGGVLFLGPSEGVGDLTNEFQAIDYHWKIFRKVRDNKSIVGLRTPSMHHLPQPRLPGMMTKAAFQQDSLDAAYRDILERYAPPSVLINRQREVVHVFQGAAEYLRLKPGPRSDDILDLCEADLRIALAGAIQRAVKEKATVAYKGVAYKQGDEKQRLKVSVTPLAGAQDPVYLLVTLEAQEPLLPVVDHTEAIDVDEVSRDRIAHLETELHQSRESLQTTVEELEASNEELHATNEELVASNEELQSTNEELQSVNEELFTVNAEYQRKITELTELSEDMENLLANADVGVLFLDRDLYVRKFTPRLAQSFNIVEQDIGRPFEHFTHNIEHDGLSDDVRWVLSTGLPFEKDVVDRSGHWHFLRVLPYQSKANVQGVVLTLIDIHSIKQAEAKLSEKQRQLQGVLDNSPAFVYVKDLQGRYQLANRRCRKVLGRSLEKVLGKTDYELLPRAIADRLSSHDRHVADTGRAKEVEEVIPHNGKGRTYLANLYPLRDEQGRVAATAGILTDITRQKIAERRANEAVRQRDRFLAMLSHELRNPLAAISSASKLLEHHDGSNEPSRQIAEVISRQSRQTTRLLDDLLDVSRISEGKIVLRKEVVDLRSTAESAVEASRGVIERHQHQFEMEVPDHALLVEGDPARLQQIQVNLLVNAAKYTPDGGHIRLRLAEEDDCAVISVADTGVGMTREFQKKVFQLFVQSEKTLEQRDGGIGLGLTLVRSLAELHGGKAEAHSEGAGKGSTFTVRLPKTAKSLKQKKAESGGWKRPSAPLKILLVEDNVDAREITRMLLETYGFDVEAVGDGLTALTTIEAHSPDVALVDIGLPEMDGYEVARRVRQSGRKLRMIAVTGYGQDEDRRRAVEAGFDEHLTKPINFDDLESILNNGAA